MSITSVAATAPQAARAATIDVSLHVDQTLGGRPARLDHAWANAATRFELDAPAGAELRVHTPDGVDMSPSTWGNFGKTGVSFARDGADWVATADVPIRQLTLQTSARQRQDGGPVRVTGDGAISVEDLAPTLTVAGVPQSAQRPEVHVAAPLGWQTTSADGTADALRMLTEGGDTVVADRPAARGAATLASFTGRAPDGAPTTGAGRVAQNVVHSTGDAAARAAYLAMLLLDRVRR